MRNRAGIRDGQEALKVETVFSEQTRKRSCGEGHEVTLVGDWAEVTGWRAGDRESTRTVCSAVARIPAARSTRPATNGAPFFIPLLYAALAVASACEALPPSPDPVAKAYADAWDEGSVKEMWDLLPTSRVSASGRKASSTAFRASLRR